MPPKRRLEDITGEGPAKKKGKEKDTSDAQGSDAQGSEDPPCRIDTGSSSTSATVEDCAIPAQRTDAAASGHAQALGQGTHTAVSPGSPAPVQASENMSIAPSSVVATKDEEELASYGVFDAADIRRFKSVLSFSRASDHMYSILCAPSQLSWGRISGFKTLPSNTLHIKGTNTPLVLWHLGEITKAYIYSPQGNPYENVSIMISPLTSAGIAASQRFLRTYSDSAAITAQDKAADEVRASCWTNTGDHRGQAFQQIFDATHRLARKSAMPTMDGSDLRIGDVVVLETTVNRYHLNSDRGKNSGPFRASYEMSSVAVLRRAAEKIVPASAPSPDVDI